MHFYQSDSGKKEEDYRQFAGIPLPGAAVVIDVRENSEYDVPLLQYLASEVEDLAREMRLNQVPRWRHFGRCIDFLKLAVLSPSERLHEESDFVLTTRHGKQILVRGLNDLSALVGRDYLDCVRNHRINAINDVGDEGGDFEGIHIDPEQPTVRVFFLTDMESKNSIDRAITYADWLKLWVEEQHGPKRFNQDKCIQAILICLNADTAIKPDTLFPARNQDAGMPIDICILLQKYRDDAAYIGGDEQILHIELMLYTLLLYWPQIFEETIDNVQELEAIALVNNGYELPCPTYTLGIAAREYSARWGARWLDYAVTAKLLQVLGDTEEVEQEERQFIKANIRKWLRNWWKELKAMIPSEAVAEIDDLQIYHTMQQLLQDNSFRRSTPTGSLQALRAFYLGISELYVGTNDVTLQHAMTTSSRSIVNQFKWVSAQSTRANQEPAQDDAQPGEFYSKLTNLYTKIRQFLPLHFQEAQGVLPRAASQLAALTEEATALRAIEQNPPDLHKCQQDFLQQADEAYNQLERQLKIWRVPVLGAVLCSTIVSVLAVILLGIVLVFGVNWGIVQANILPSVPYDFLHTFDFLRNIILLGIDAVLVLLLASCEYLYLVARNRALQQERSTIHRQLQGVVQGHLSAVQDVIAARVALMFLQWADLYVPGKSISPYEQRIRDLIKQLQRTQEQAARQQRIVDQRIKPLLDWQHIGTTEQSRWPDLNNRIDLLPWEQLEDAFLHSCQELTSSPLSLNLLSEMLLRRLGTEKPANILQDIIDKRLQSPRGGSEEQFQALVIMLVTVVLALDIVNPDVSDIVPLLQQYTTLKERYALQIPETGINMSGMQRALKEAVLTQALQGKTNMALSLLEGMAVEEVLATWVGFQHKSDPVLEHILTSNDVVQCLVERQAALSQVLDSLRVQSTLLGYRDDMTSEDYTYLLLAPGEASEAFLTSSDQKNVTLVHSELFPDKEKLVYMHIHRIRQLSTAVLLSKKKRG